MIPERNNQRSVVSTVTGEKIAMSIDQAAMAHIMNVLTDLYSDPEQAVIREYSTNARDAHIEAGKGLEPILVTTPSPLSPFLTIQDFGVGLSPDDIEAIYSRYGASTKRASNDVVGMLGLGCKSALTYAEQFTLVGVKDGVRQQVLISRDADGAGSMTVVSTEQTNEPNGVIIKVPAKTGNRFSEKALKFFKYWPKGSVLVDGKPPVELNGQKITDTLYLVTAVQDRWADRAQDVVVMGGVPYPADLDPHNRLNNNASFVAYVPIGAVEFTPSREALQMTPKTTSAIQKLVSEVHAHLDTAIIKDVDGQPTKAAALKSMNAWNRAIRGGQQSRQYTYKGKPIPEGYTIPIPHGHVAPVEPLHTLRVNTNTLSSSMTQRSIAIGVYPECVFIVNYSGKWTAPRRKKLDKFIAELSNPPTDYTSYVLVPGKPDFDGWVDPSRIFDWADVNAVKLDRQYTAVGGMPARITGSYDLIDESGSRSQVLAKDVRTTEPLYFLRANSYRAGWYTKYLRATHDKFTLVYMPKNRIEKFKRDFPTAVELTQHLRDEAKAWKDKLTKSEQAAIAQHDMGMREVFRAMDENKVDDPELKAAVRLAKVSIDKKVNERDTLNQFSTGSMSQNGWKNPLDKSKYPIFDTWEFERAIGSTTKCEHWLLYLNAAFKAATP